MLKPLNCSCQNSRWNTENCYRLIWNKMSHLVNLCQSPTCVRVLLHSLSTNLYSTWREKDETSINYLFPFIRGTEIIHRTSLRRNTNIEFSALWPRENGGQGKCSAPKKREPFLSRLEQNEIHKIVHIIKYEVIKKPCPWKYPALEDFEASSICLDFYWSSGWVEKRSSPFWKT